jgi:transposase InsO family protein
MSEFLTHTHPPGEGRPEAGLEAQPLRPAHEHHSGEAVAAAGGAERGRSPSAATEAAATASPPPRAPVPPGSPDSSLVPEQAEEEVADLGHAPRRDSNVSLDSLLRSGERGILPRLGQGHGGRRLVKPEPVTTPPLTPQQRLLLLDIWQRSGLPAADFGALVGLSKHTLYAWKKRFAAEGPAGLLDRPRGGPPGSRVADLTKRTILMLKQSNPDWGCQRISDLLLRGPALPVSAAAVARVLHEAGYELEEVPTRPHPDKVRRFERARPNQLWQTDLFTFVLKRQNRRVYLVAFMDDHSRFIVGYGLHASQSSALVLEVLRAALTSHGTPQEILTDNGSQYVTWRGTSAFSKELSKHGIRQVVAAPRRPQTLGKIERFWGTLWRECVERAVFMDMGDAQRRIGLFIDHYNFQRPHQGLGGPVPADRYFGVASEVNRTLKARVAANALELARQGVPRAPFYLTGQVGGQPFSVHAEGERMILTRPQSERQEIDLVPPGPAEVSSADLPEPVCPVGVVTALSEVGQEEPPAPGTSPLDVGLDLLAEALGDRGDHDRDDIGDLGDPGASNDSVATEGGQP